MTPQPLHTTCFELFTAKKRQRWQGYHSYKREDKSFMLHSYHDTNSNKEDKDFSDLPAVLLWHHQCHQEQRLVLSSNWNSFRSGRLDHQLVWLFPDKYGEEASSFVQCRCHEEESICFLPSHKSKKRYTLLPFMKKIIAVLTPLSKQGMHRNFSSESKSTWPLLCFHPDVTTNLLQHN